MLMRQKIIALVLTAALTAVSGCATNQVTVSTSSMTGLGSERVHVGIAYDSAWRGDTGPPAVVYTYAPGRGAAHAATLLAGYCGIVQCDGYAAYKQLARRGRAGNAVILAFCWAHWRRRFYEIAKAGSAPIAEEALRRIAELYKIEAHIRGRSAEERRSVRQAESKPLVAALKVWLQAQLARASAKSAIAVAIRTDSITGKASNAFSRTGGSRSIPTWSSVRCGQLPSIARMHSSPAMMREPRIGLAWLR